MTSIEALALIPLLITIIIFNAALADAMRGELEGVQLLKAELERCLGNRAIIINGSLLP
jgi:hypothetical protein